MCIVVQHPHPLGQRKSPNGHLWWTTCKTDIATTTLSHHNANIQSARAEIARTGFYQVCSCLLYSMFCDDIRFESLFTLGFISLGSKALCKVDKILTNNMVLSDVEKLSSRYQTSTLEAFHSVISHFTPKSVVFPFIGMLCRYILSHLHLLASVK